MTLLFSFCYCAFFFGTVLSFLALPKKNACPTAGGKQKRSSAGLYFLFWHCPKKETKKV
jgi:hypothetical protein